MAVTFINYTGRKSKLKYESVEVSYDYSKQKKVFDSGNFVKDWFDCMKFIIFELSDKEYGFANSSCVDHFIMDGAPYESAYLKPVDKKNDDKWFLDYVYVYQDVGIEFFVAKGTKPTWEELKTMCGHIKQEVVN